MRYALVLVALLAAGCGSDSPVAPTPPPPAQIAGGWTGAVQYSVAGTPGFQAIVLDLTQASSNVNGTYAAQNFNGTVTGTTTVTSFSGTFTFNSRTTSGAACTGTFAVSGSAGQTTMSWTSPAITANCTNLPTGLTIAIQRR